MAFAFYRKMNKQVTLVAISAFILSGCVKNEDFEKLSTETQSQFQDIRKEMDTRLSTIDRYSTYFTDPVIFEFHDVTIEEDEVTGVIRSLDERIKDKTLFLDTTIVVYSGQTKIKDSPDYFYVTDGIGKIDSELWFSSSDKNKISQNEELRVEFHLHGWGEMFPAKIEMKK